LFLGKGIARFFLGVPYHPITPPPPKKFFARVIGFLKQVGKLFIDRKTSIRNTAMNSAFKFKLIQALNKKNGNKGFTLIELLVVVIIIGVLAAIALPNLLGQVAKGRQAEARTNLGAINRAQQVNRVETGTFAPLTSLPISVTGTYYTFTGPNAASATGAVTDATAISTYQNDIRDYSGGVGQTTAGVFSSVICETVSPTATLVSATTTDGTAACPAGSTQVQ
jgi:prepilin-type N-terminal cleavage/methylation domain-containing protein